ncbi:hypothetical protein A4X13_0g7966 [Tilletia indica]|uniref:Uncharacterized protein n=1 Tax=Tilletia indica TaxID=43049 RepID=A0A177TP51_9BASI|nr:hypothetical protein A4X13_0g7966 [Tilletia indica]
MHKANKPNAPVASLSSKLQGLKFMQRGAATAPTPTALIVKSEQQDPNSVPSKEAASTQVNGAPQSPVPVRTDGTEDGNAEHWVLPSLSTATSIPPSSNSSRDDTASREAAAFGALGWNDWLVAHQQERSGTKRKRRPASEEDGEEEKKEEEEEDVKDLAGQGEEGVTPTLGGRRKFGAWVETGKKRRKSGDGDEDNDVKDEDDDEGNIIVKKEEPSTHNRFAAVREAPSSSGLRKSTGQGKKAGISQSSGRSSSGSSHEKGSSRRNR